jgi:uncharacterized membrane protein (UPF0127 family)
VRSSAVWAWVGVALAVVGIVAWFVVASVALDADPADDARPSGAIAAALRDPSPAAPPYTGMTEIALGIDGDCKRVVVADDDTERGQGLRGRRATAPYDGMLFVFDGPTDASFTMSGVPVPLDIGFYGADGQPVSRLRMEPCAEAEAECPAYRSDDEIVYALETEAGALGSGSLQACPS